MIYGVALPHHLSIEVGEIPFIGWKDWRGGGREGVPMVRFWEVVNPKRWTARNISAFRNLREFQILGRP